MYCSLVFIFLPESLRRKKEKNCKRILRIISSILKAHSSVLSRRSEYAAIAATAKQSSSCVYVCDYAQNSSNPTIYFHYYLILCERKRKLKSKHTTDCYYYKYKFDSSSLRISCVFFYNNFIIIIHNIIDVCL